MAKIEGKNPFNKDISSSIGIGDTSFREHSAIKHIFKVYRLSLFLH